MCVFAQFWADSCLRVVPLLSRKITRQRNQIQTKVSACSGHEMSATITSKHAPLVKPHSKKVSLTRDSFERKPQQFKSFSAPESWVCAACFCFCKSVSKHKAQKHKRFPGEYPQHGTTRWSVDLSPAIVAHCNNCIFQHV